MKRSPAPSKGVHLHGSVVVGTVHWFGLNCVYRGASANPRGCRGWPECVSSRIDGDRSDAHVGHGVEVKNSVLMADASVGHLSYVGDSVLGRGVNFGAGTNVANLRHDDTTVRMTVKGDRVDTGRRKLGAIVGDGAKPGSTPH